MLDKKRTFMENYLFQCQRKYEIFGHLNFQMAGYQSSSNFRYVKQGPYFAYNYMRGPIGENEEQ